MAKIDASRLQAERRKRGFTQRALAVAAGITRQAVGAIESGGMQPSVGIALELARALGMTVEALFGHGDAPAPLAERTAVATIGGRAVTHRLDAEHLAIEPAVCAVPNVFVGGCDVSLGLLSRHATAHTRDLRVLWLPMTNRTALAALEHGTLHAAVVHDACAAKVPREGAYHAFEIAKTDAGWLVRRGNPLGLRGARDVVRTKARLANRPPGAGARLLLDAELRRAAVDRQHVTGYDRELAGQSDAGRAVVQGFADVAIGMASVAGAYGLDFLPLREERCTLIVPVDAAQTPEVRLLLAVLRSASYRRDLEALRAYDVTKSGERIA